MSFLYQRVGPYCPLSSTAGWMGIGRVHCNYDGLIKLGLMGVGAGISVDA